MIIKQWHPKPFKMAESLSDEDAFILKTANKVKGRKKKYEKEVSLVEAEFIEMGFINGLPPRFRVSIKRNFINKIPLETLCDYAEYAAASAEDLESAFKIFCRVCWDYIKESPKTAEKDDLSRLNLLTNIIKRLDLNLTDKNEKIYLSDLGYAMLISSMEKPVNEIVKAIDDMPPELLFDLSVPYELLKREFH